MRKITAISLAALGAFVAMPLGAQGTGMSYDERITCSALLFLSSQEAEDPKMEEQFAAHHLSKAIETHGKQQDAAIADVERRMGELAPAWTAQDAALGETYSACIMTVINEFEG